MIERKLIYSSDAISVYHHKIADIFEGFKEHINQDIQPSPATSFFCLPNDPHELPDVKSVTFECSHHFPRAKDESLEKAFAEFETQARFPYPSLMDRFTIFWRRNPEIVFEQEFDSGRAYFKIAARYSLVLDYKPFDEALAEKEVKEKAP